MKEFKFKIGGQDYAATVEDLKDGQMKVTVNGQTYQVEVPQTKAQGPRVAMAPAAPEAQKGGTKNVNTALMARENFELGYLMKSNLLSTSLPFSVLPSLRDRASIRATCLLRW